MEQSLVCILPKRMRLSEVTLGLGEAARMGEETRPRPVCLGSQHGTWGQREPQVDAGASAPAPDAGCCLFHGGRLFLAGLFGFFGVTSSYLQQ